MLYMSFGRGRWSVYDLLVLGLAAAIVFPDKALDWLGTQTGRTFGSRHVVYLEVAAIVLLVSVMVLLARLRPNREWWFPLLLVGLVGLFRLLMRVGTSLLGLNE